MFLLLTALPLLAEAQTSVGVRGGVSLSSLSYRYALGRPVQFSDGISAQTYSFVIEHFGQKNAGVQFELQYITLGYSQENDQLMVNRTEMDYLKMPLLSNFYFGRSGRFHIKLGPHLGYLLNARDVTREFDVEEVELPTYGQAGDDPKRLMYGLSLGAGISKLFGKSTLAADGRFSYEFGDPESQDRIFDLNTTTIEITLTYLFQIRKGKWQN
ncbi:porin family protein [Mongoliibacter ruber]